MPWLIKDQPKMEDNLFFVHVPRCCGTSLMKSLDVPRKCRQGRSLWGNLGMRVFFQRYAVLESANFPIFTNGNALACVLFAIAFVLRFATDSPALHVLSTCLIIGATLFVVFLSFVCTAPTIGRVRFIRRSYLLFVHYMLCRFMESIDWCTGTNKKGYINHLTAQKLLDYGYIEPCVLSMIPNFAIVRNPYSRMVSIYMYNRFGSLESFTHFVKSWYNMMKDYRESREMEEWYTPCHGIPQFEYTHRDGKQLVRSIIKQEELKLLKTKEEQLLEMSNNSTSNLPDIIRKALLEMPHTNQRATEKKWYDFYTQDTLNLVYDLYKSDFDAFAYPAVLSIRPDLQPPSPLSDGNERNDSKLGHASTQESFLDSNESHTSSKKQRGMEDEELGNNYGSLSP